MLHSDTNFKHKLSGQEIGDFTKKLDYSLCQKERLDLAENILYGENNSLNPYFEEYFDNYYKVHAGQLDPLAEDDNVCQALDSIANYILYSPDSERITKKTKYNFYTEQKLQEKINKEISIEEVVDTFKNNNKNFDSNIYNEVLDFLVVKGHNNKRIVKQKIYMNDLCDHDFDQKIIFKNDGKINKNKKYTKQEVENLILSYQSLIFLYQGILQQLKLKGSPKYTQRIVGKKIKDLKEDQITAKDQIKGTIYFKKIIPDSDCVDYQMFDFKNKKHVMALLKCFPKPLTNEMGMLTFDLQNLINQCDLNEDELKTLTLYRDEDFTLDKIANEIGENRDNVRMKIEKIANRVIKKYNDQYIDWLYLNCLKGTYKTCPLCGEIKLVQQFGKDSTKKDGYHLYCKTCR